MPIKAQGDRWAWAGVKHGTRGVTDFMALPLPSDTRQYATTENHVFQVFASLPESEEALAGTGDFFDRKIG